MFLTELFFREEKRGELLWLVCNTALSHLNKMHVRKLINKSPSGCYFLHYFGTTKGIAAGWGGKVDRKMNDISHRDGSGENPERNNEQSCLIGLERTPFGVARRGLEPIPSAYGRASHQQGSMLAFEGSVPCSLEPRQWSEGVLTPSPATGTPSMFFLHRDLNPKKKKNNPHLAVSKENM